MCLYVVFYSVYRGLYCFIVFMCFIRVLSCFIVFYHVFCVLLCFIVFHQRLLYYRVIALYVSCLYVYSRLWCSAQLGWVNKRCQALSDRVCAVNTMRDAFYHVLSCVYCVLSCCILFIEFYSCVY
jgi:hypothetical protein